MEEFGIEEYGLTDHIHTAYNLPDIVSARRDYLASRPPANFHFGVEVSCVDQRECDRVAAGDYTAWGDEPVYGFRDMTDYTGQMAIGITPDEIRELGIEYVVGGVHWPLTVSEDRDALIRNYVTVHGGGRSKSMFPCASMRTGVFLNLDQVHRLSVSD